MILLKFNDFKISLLHAWWGGDNSNAQKHRYRNNMIKTCLADDPRKLKSRSSKPRTPETLPRQTMNTISKTIGSHNTT